MTHPGVRVLMLCGRDDPKVESGPNFEQLQSQMEDDRVNKRAQAYLRDLRRDARQLLRRLRVVAGDAGAAPVRDPLPRASPSGS